MYVYGIGLCFSFSFFFWDDWRNIMLLLNCAYHTHTLILATMPEDDIKRFICCIWFDGIGFRICIGACVAASVRRNKWGAQQCCASKLLPPPQPFEKRLYFHWGEVIWFCLLLSENIDVRYVYKNPSSYSFRLLWCEEVTMSHKEFTLWRKMPQSNASGEWRDKTNISLGSQ